MITPSFALTATERVLPRMALDFTTASLDSRVTLTRAGNTATCVNSSGNIALVNANLPRFDFNPTTLACNGLLIEESRTNSIRNNTMVGAVAGTPGTLPTDWFVFTSLTGLTTSVVGTGTESGITYLDLQIQGTPSGAGNYDIGFIANNQVSASTGQTWNESLYYKIAYGSASGISNANFRFNEYNLAAVFVTAQSSANLTLPTTSSLISQRVNATVTLNGGITTAFIQGLLRLALSGSAINITLRIGLPQLELGAFPTSVIPTTGSQVTRTADVATMTGTNFSSWFNQTQGTAYAEYNIPAIAAGASLRAFSLLGAGGITVDEMPLFILQASGKAVSANAFTGGVNAGRMDTTVNFVANTTIKAIFAYGSNFRSLTANSVAPTISTAIFTIPTCTNAGIGNASGINQINGYIRKINFYPQVLTNAELQAFSK